MTSPEQLLITEQQIITPVIKVLEEAKSNPLGKEQPREVSKSLQESLNDLFPEQRYEDKDIQKARQILGERAVCLTNEQLKDVVTETQYLVSTWLDDFEREIFGGQTLKELLHEKGGL